MMEFQKYDESHPVELSIDENFGLYVFESEEDEKHD